MKAMVLAAGVGSRLDPLTARMPKNLVPVANRPVMEHILNLLKKHGVKEIVSNLHYLPDQIVDYFGDGSRFGVSLSFLHEEKLSGDAGGVRACRRFLEDDTFIVMMGDLLTDADLTDIVRQHKEKKALATIGIKKVDDVSQFGVVLTDSEGFITGFQEKPDPKEALSDLASTGIYILEPEVFRHIPTRGEYGFGRQLFPALVSAGQPVLAAEIKTYWSDVGTIRQYRLANFDALESRLEVELHGERTDEGWLAEGVSLGPGCRIEGKLMAGAGTVIGPGVSVRGCAVVGERCVIEEGAVLENSVIWSGTRVERQALVRDSVIGSGCVVTNGATCIEATTASAVV